MNTNWPLDDKGNPLDQVSHTLKETINVGNYSSFVIGPTTVTRFVPEDEVEAGFEQCKEELNKFLAQERDRYMKAFELI